jgi:hypothetical protein
MHGGADRPKPAPPTVASVVADPLTDDDTQLALWMLHELHYLGFDGVDPALEWDPTLLALRRELEQRLEDGLRERTRAVVDETNAGSGDVADGIFTLCARDDAPGPLDHLREYRDREHLLELLMHRSVYQLKEADPQSWMLPRLRGRAKTALLEIQYDEYGSARTEHVHQTLYANTLAACGLDPGYGAYVDQAPGSTLLVSNVASMLGLQRRLLPAAAGNFAAVEATSSLPSRKMSALMRRLGLGEDATRFFDEHIEADAVHEQVAARELCGALVETDPALRREVLFGAACCLLVEGVFGGAVVAAWQDGRSSLYARGSTRDVPEHVDRTTA